jgi:hypothetical protein
MRPATNNVAEANNVVLCRFHRKLAYSGGNIKVKFSDKYSIKEEGAVRMRLL